MALDTEQKRRAALGYGKAWRPVEAVTPGETATTLGRASQLAVYEPTPVLPFEGEMILPGQVLLKWKISLPRVARRRFTT